MQQDIISKTVINIFSLQLFYFENGFYLQDFEHEIDDLKAFFFETSKFTVLLYFSNQFLIA